MHRTPGCTDELPNAACEANRDDAGKKTLQSDLSSERGAKGHRAVRPRRSDAKACCLQCATAASVQSARRDSREQEGQREGRAFCAIALGQKLMELWAFVIDACPDIL